MSEPHPINKNELFSSLPPVWSNESLRLEINQYIKRSNLCIVALDDDPTGTQTVHDVWVLTKWGVGDLEHALRQEYSALYLLTNSRSESLLEARKINSEIARNLGDASLAVGRPVWLVSRSDSTLRGHFPGEVEALRDSWEKHQGIRFDGICIIPYFAEGGRYTIDDIHWVDENGKLIPVAQTPYARDPVFGYCHSGLPDWVEEKTAGNVAATDVLSISLDLIRTKGPKGVAQFLRGVTDGHIVVVNAADDRDLEVLASAHQEVEVEGKHFLFRTAASFVKIAAGLPDQPLLDGKNLMSNRHKGGGLIIFGSYVPRSNQQLEKVRLMDGVVAVELDVKKVLDNVTREAAISEAANTLNQALAVGHDALLFTSRERATGSEDQDNLAIAKVISLSVVEVVRLINREPRYIIGKGGITSSDLATKAMRVSQARVLGQIYPGVPVWELSQGSRWLGMPYVVFPGNVGDTDTVEQIVRDFQDR